jgi:hypothetical protein
MRIHTFNSSVLRRERKSDLMKFMAQGMPNDRKRSDCLCALALHVGKHDASLGKSGANAANVWCAVGAKWLRNTPWTGALLGRFAPILRPFWCFMGRSPHFRPEIYTVKAPIGAFSGAISTSARLAPGCFLCRCARAAAGLPTHPRMSQAVEHACILFRCWVA